MNREKTIAQALESADRSLLLIATADGKGVPHMAAANSIKQLEVGRIAITEWFCPETIANIEIGCSISIVVWDPVLDKGHQFIGCVDRMDEIAIMNGYQAEEEPTAPLPQQEYRLIIDVGKVMAFGRGFHSDVEE